MARILVVDDHEEITDLLRSILDGHDIDAAASANEAAGRVARQQYDLVIMDIALRRSSGVTAALALRGLGYEGPIIALTADLVPDDELLFERARFAGKLGKPSLPDAIRAAVGQHVR